MASGLVASLLSSASKLLDLLHGAPTVSCRGGRRRSVSADVQRLHRLLRRIQATLDDAGDREVRDGAVKLWIEELTEVARDAEDVLDDYRYELIRRRVQELQGGGGGGGATSSTSSKRKHGGEEDRGIYEDLVGPLGNLHGPLVAPWVYLHQASSGIIFKNYGTSCNPQDGSSYPQSTTTAYKGWWCHT